MPSCPNPLLPARPALGFLGALSLAAALPAPAGAATFTALVTADSVDAAPGDGVCADAGGACTLRAAVMEANALGGPDTVALGAGTYLFTRAGADEDEAATGDLDVLDDLAVTGMGAGATVIHAAGLDRAFHGIGGVDLTVSGVTIRNGYARGTLATPTYGGAIFMYDYPSDGNLTVLDSDLRDNTVEDPLNAYGGAIATTGSGLLEVRGTVLIGNAATGSTNNVGGAIRTGYGSTTVLSDCVLRGNSADLGGGAFLNGDSEIDDTTVEGNTSSGDGAGLYLFYFDHFMVGSTVSGNLSSAGGGGLFTFGANLLFENSTLSGNQALRGAGALVSSGWIGLLHATVTLNSATGDTTTGGIWLKESSGEATNTILARNNGASRPDCRGTFTSLGHNLVGVKDTASGTVCDGFTTPGDQVGDRAAPVDPRLGALQSNGGPTRTHALKRLSPALDAADDSLMLTSDQRGVARPRDGDADGVARSDIGAFER